MNFWEYEEDAEKHGYKCIAGVDEAGRGPLAGPVYAAAVILPFGLEIQGINDSKKLTAKKRDELYDVIKEAAIAYAVVSCDEKIIDEINILQAALKAMREAVMDLAVVPDLVLIDGNKKPDLPMDAQAIVKGDGKSASIAAASILAKVSRDRFMEQMHEKYPQYNFAKHKGYPTKEHREAVIKYGACPIHRKSFLGNILK